MKCPDCGHNQNIHHIIDGKRVCNGESYPCNCIKEYYESDKE